jgi:dihydrofolate synthase/folylpolyglutamate synthase
VTYSEAIQFLYSLRWFGTKLGLQNTVKLAELAGNPHHQLRFIHVAGTNGKGSTCAMLESIYRTAGLRVGLFTSPHLVAFGERIQVNRDLISEADVVRLVSELKPLLATFSTDEHPTFFEVITVMALRYFAEQKCDLVIWETGLGGRLDATNIVTPLASVITNIQYDHQKWLGETLCSIAAEKAGIIKPSVPIITATDEPEALSAIQETARAQNSPLTVVSTAEAQGALLSTLELPLSGVHQRLNAALALATVRVLASEIPITDATIRSGFLDVNWPGRLQLITRPSGQRILLDGAHNIAGAQTLANSLRQYFPGIEPTLILGILQDKDWQTICRILAPLASRLLLAPVPSERSANPDELASACREANPSILIQSCASLAQALSETTGESFVLITGSLYLVGEAIDLFGLSPSKAHDERGLNEWSAVPTHQSTNPPIH